MYFLCDQVRKIDETDKDYRNNHEKRDNISIVCIQLRWCIKVYIDKVKLETNMLFFIILHLK